MFKKTLLFRKEDLKDFNLVGLLVLAVILLYRFISYNILTILNSSSDNQISSLSMFIIAFALIVSIFIPCVVYLKKLKIPLRKGLALNGFPIVQIPLMMLLGFLSIFAEQIITLPIDIVFEKYNIHIPGQLPTPSTIQGILLMIFCIAIVPGIMEELLFRGICFTQIKTIGKGTGIIASSLYFAGYHEDISNFFGPLVIGFLLCYLFLIYNSIIAPMIVHISYNTTCILFKYLEDFHSNSLILLQKKNELYYYLFAFVLFIVFLAFVKKLYVKNPVKINISDFTSVFNIVFNIPIIILILLFIVTNLKNLGWL